MTHVILKTQQLFSVIQTFSNLFCFFITIFYKTRDNTNVSFLKDSFYLISNPLIVMYYTFVEILILLYKKKQQHDNRSN